MSATELLAAQGVRKVYHNGTVPLVVLDDVELSVSAHTMTTIMGASGAGKSTLLHILGALDRPSDGEVVFDGRSIYTLSDRARAQVRNRDFGFVFQFYHLMPEFTAFENVLLPSMVARQVDADCRARAAELLANVGLADRAWHYPSQLSGGEQQRVAIARALINEPQVLFADEPTGNLDRANSDTVMATLLEVQRRLAFALVMVTHDEELAACGTRQLQLQDGRLHDTQPMTMNQPAELNL
jgi:lipoprotein-releasing system ATP-binding protein